MPPHLRLISNPISPQEVKKKLDPEPAKCILPGWFRGIEKKYETGSTKLGTQPFYLGNIVRNRLNPGDVTLLVSEPYSGATAVLLKIVEEYNYAGLPVLYSSSALKRYHFLNRLAASVTEIPFETIQSARLHEEQWAKLTKFGGIINQAAIFFSNDYEFDPVSLQQGMGLWHQAHNRQGLMIFDDFFDMATEEENLFSSKIRKLKKIARECRCPVIATMRLGSIVDFYEKLKYCSDSKLLNKFHRAGPLMILTEQNHVRYVHFIPPHGQRNECLRIALRHDSASICYLF